MAIIKSKLNIYLAQVNYQYGDNVFVPYSAGSIQAYARTIPEVRDNFQFHNPLFLREDPVKVVRSMHEPAIVGLSCYLWNWEYNKALAQAVKAAYPKTLIIFGGTQSPDLSQDFFRDHPYVDILVHHEGELSFVDIALEFLSGNPDYTKIAGLSVRVEGNQTLKTIPRGRITDLSKLPSPYLSGVFDFMLDRPFTLNVSQETNRGCPYECTFCDWGGATYNKVTSVDEERILEEFRWFGKHKAEYIFNCDANYGILSRDLSLTLKMVEIRSQYGGYPRKFRMCTAKNSNDKIFDIAKILNDADMNKGATLSFQSMDDNTLAIVKRKNIKIDKFSELMDRYRKAGIATYTELIMGMPGESYESSKKGIDTLLDGQEDAVNIYVYVCTMLPNSPMSNPDYINSHSIRSVVMPILLAHSTPDPNLLAEYHRVAIETSTMPNQDWQRTYLFYWAVQAFHCLGLIQYPAILLHKQFGLSYSEFYERFINYFSADEKTLTGSQLAIVRSIISEATKGGRLDMVIPKFGGIYWPLEEASFLNLIIDKDRFYGEIRNFLGNLAGDLGLEAVDTLLDDVVLYQSARMVDPATSDHSINIRYDLHDYFRRVRDASATLNELPCRLNIKADKNFSGDLEKYAREVVWYGRKGGVFHHTDITKEVI